MVPRVSSVGSGPTEKIILRIVDATNVRTPDSRGRVITMAADTNITAHINPDKCCPNSGRKKKKCIIMNSINFIQRRCYHDSMAIKVLYSSCILYSEASYTYLHTPWSTVLLTGLQLVKKFPTF